jgi:hypothetical protein
VCLWFRRIYLKPIISDLSGKRPPESPLIDLGEDFAWGEAFTDKYDYESDSDLDDEGEYTFDRSQPPASVYECKYGHI